MSCVARTTVKFVRGSKVVSPGLDSRFVTSGGVALSAQAVGSVTTRNGETSTAPLWSLDVRRAGKHFGWQAAFAGVGDEFVAAAGFVGTPDAVTVGGSPSWTMYGKPGAFLARATLGTRVNLRWTYDQFTGGEQPQDKQLFFTGSFQFRGGWGLDMFNWIENFGYDKRLYTEYALERHNPSGVVDTIIPYPGSGINRNLGLMTTLSTPWVGPFSGTITVTYGRDVNYFEWSPADIFWIDSHIAFRPTNKVRVEGTYVLTNFQRATDGTTVSVTHIPRIRLEYQVSRSLFVRVVEEYTSETRDALRDDGRTNDPILIYDPSDATYKRSLAEAQANHGLRSDFLVSFQPSPGTVFFAGYGGSYVDTGRFKFSGLSRTEDGFFLKASYLFRL